MIRVTDDEVRELREKAHKWWTTDKGDPAYLIAHLADTVDALVAERTELRQEIHRLERG